MTDREPRVLSPTDRRPADHDGVPMCSHLVCPKFNGYSGKCSELSMIASHLAAGGSFCCVANADARELVTRNKRKQDILAEHAYEAWGCYGDNKGEPGSGSRAFSGQGPYGWVTPRLKHTEADTANKRESELRRAEQYFRRFLEDISRPFVGFSLNTELRSQPITVDIEKRLHSLEERVDNLENHPAGCTCTWCTG